MRLTRDEILLLVGIMIALVAGVVVKHYRAERRAATEAGMEAQSH